MYEEHDDYEDRPRKKSRRPAEIKSWFVCAMFGMAIGYGAAASLGDAVDAARIFLQRPDRAHDQQRAFGDGLFDDRTSIPTGAQAEAQPRFIRLAMGPRDLFPGAAVQTTASEEAGELAPGARLVLNGRVGLVESASGGR